MNLPPIGEETFLICMALATLAGALLGFALGYELKEKRHAEEMAAVIRIAKRIHEAVHASRPWMFQAVFDPSRLEKERAPRGPCLTRNPKLSPDEILKKRLPPC